MPIVLHLHVHLSHIVRPLADGLDGELAQRHLATDNYLQRLDGSIHRTVSAGRCLEAFAADVQSHSCYAANTHTCGHLQVIQLYGVRSRAVGTRQHQDIVVRHLLLLISQLQECLVDVIQPFAVHLYAVHMQTVLQCCTSAAGRQHDGVIVYSHILGVHDFVGRCILQHTVLVNAARVGKGIATHDGLVGLYGHIHQARHHAADGEYLRGVDVRIDIEIRMCLQRHHHLLQAGVSGTFANTVYGHLHLSRTIQHTSQSVRCGHTQVVVAVGREDCLSCRQSIHMLHQILYLVAKFVGQTETCGIRDVHHCGTSLHYGLHHTGQILVVRATGIFGIELHILHIALGILHGSHSAFYDFFGSRIKLVPDVALAGSDTRMYALVLGILQRLGCHIDIFFHSTCQSTYRGPRHCLRYLHHAVKVARTRDGKTRLYNVHTQQLQLSGYLYFLHGVQLTAGHLLAVAQRRIEYKQSFAHSFTLKKFGRTKIRHYFIMSK